MRFSSGLGVLALAAVFAASGGVAAQATATIQGRVTAVGGGNVAGAQVVVVNMVSGTETGAVTNNDGRYSLTVRAGGPYQVEARMIGYGAQTVENIGLSAGEARMVDFELNAEAIMMDALEVFASTAEEGVTPVAYAEVSKIELQQQLGSRDLPMILNTTPSVYSTVQGGGAGDARINVRGFSQRNVAVMVNGVPVNDMENGWVYWSNWSGIGDATEKVQLQRGLSAVNLATPSIGGTLNILTDPSRMGTGVTYKQEAGNGGFLKESLMLSTGNLGKFSAMGSFVRKTQDGLIGGGLGGESTWTDEWGYYFAAHLQMNENNRLELYAVGAPQRHGQNLYKLNIATLSRSFAEGLDDYDPAAFDKFELEAGRKWGPNVNTVSSSYTGQQYTSTGPTGQGTFNRRDPNYINERENYFHKPQVNLNWYSFFGNGLSLSTVAYYSGGRGGGTGTYGSLRWDYRYTQRFADWDATIARNIDNGAGGSRGILRNSVNNQDTWGAISKLTKEFDNGMTLQVGVDWRTATIEHYREVRDLLGGSFYDDCSRGCRSDFWSGNDGQRGLGEKINYFNTNTVDWLGGYLQLNHQTENGAAWGMVGLSQISYRFENFFKDDGAGNPLVLNTGNIAGMQAKGGITRNLNPEFTLYGNLGYVSKVPIFDGVIDDNNSVQNPDPKNEKFLSFEGGLRYRGIGNGISADINVYNTTWRDRTFNVFVRNLDPTNPNGADGLVNLLGVDARHMGVEATLAYQPSEYVRFDIAGSVGNWTYLNDVSGTYKPDDQSQETQEFDFFIKDLKVADAPQTQFAYAVSLFPAPGMYLRFQGKTFARHWAAFDPFSRTEREVQGNGDIVQSWQAPGYTVFDLHAAYSLSEVLPSAGNIRLFANIYNLFDTVYIQDAVDNSRFNGFDKDHDSDSAEVFFGFPRSINLGMQVSW
jgi:iron complex outermembrane recepter protein